MRIYTYNNYNKFKNKNNNYGKMETLSHIKKI